MQFSPFFLHHVNCSGEGCLAFKASPTPPSASQQGGTISTSAIAHLAGKIAIHHQFDRYSSGKTANKPKGRKANGDRHSSCPPLSVTLWVVYRASFCSQNGVKCLPSPTPLLYLLETKEWMSKSHLVVIAISFRIVRDEGMVPYK